MRACDGGEDRAGGGVHVRLYWVVGYLVENFQGMEQDPDGGFLGKPRWWEG